MRKEKKESIGQELGYSQNIQNSLSNQFQVLLVSLDRNPCIQESRGPCAAALHGAGTCIGYVVVQ